MQQTKIAIGAILFSYHEERLVSSNLNSKQLRFHGAHPNLHIYVASVWMWNFKFGGQKLVRFWQQIYNQHIFKGKNTS